MELQPVGVLGDALIIDAAAEDSPNYFVGFLWALVICLMFFAQHHTCDAYFVPAINVFVDKMRSSPNPWLQRWGELSVAGATICALGCNGPELFSNLISLFMHSDAGIGVVVGSEIFNLLVIVGCSVLAAPKTPLALEKASFTRDCIAYAISIGLLYWALLDKKITIKESSILLTAAVGYVSAVYFTKDVEELLGGEKKRASSLNEIKEEFFAQRSFQVDAEGGADGSQPKSIKHEHTAIAHGVSVLIEEINHGRMVDAHHEMPHVVNVEAKEDGLTVVKPDKGFHMTCASDSTLLGPSVQYDHLVQIDTVGGNVLMCEFEKGAFHGLVLEKMTLKMTCATGSDRDKLVEQLKSSAPNAEVSNGYDATVVGGWKHFKHMWHDPAMSVWIKVVYGLPELFIDSCLRATLSTVDIKDITKENRWPLCFMGAMVWLATFSFCMVECATMINLNIPAIPTSFLGITVCAVGTSFPNAVASVILSSEDKPAAAIANALGSNIQNVFLAMAMPWVIYSGCNGWADIPQQVAGISEGVVWMVFTLALLLFCVLTPPCCQLTKAFGWLLNFVYLVYVVDISGETFGLWPPFMK